MGGELSERERDVLRLTAGGYSNKETAARLEVSAKHETYKVRATSKLLGLRTHGVAQHWLNRFNQK